MNQIPRDIIFEDEGREKLISGISKLAKAVKSTLGAAGQTVLIESPNHTHGIRITKDGVTVAKDIQLRDPVENLAVQMAVDVASRTATSSGDGTTTSVVLTEAFLIEGMKIIADNKEKKSEIIKEMGEWLEIVKKQLKNNSRRMTIQKIKDVATISANNDPYIGGLVAKAYKKAGKNAFVTVENSSTPDTYIEVTNGIKLKRGYDSPLYVNNYERDECVFKNPKIFLTDQTIDSMDSIGKILEYAVQSKQPLLIIGDVSREMKNVLAANVKKGNVKACTITPPNFGWKQKDLMEDLALVCGTTFYSEDQGDNLTNVTHVDLGSASKIKVSREETVISLEEDMDSERVEAIKTRIQELTAQIKTTKKKADIDHLKERIALLDGGMAVVFAGGYSDVEQKELYDRIEDSVQAVRSALESGYLPGGGTALLRISKIIHDGLYAGAITRGDANFWAGEIFIKAIAEPFKQIIRNSHWDSEAIDAIKSEVLANDKFSYGFDVKEGISKDMSDAGIIDPLKVTVNALENAVSVATTILGTNAIVTLAREE